MPYTVILNPGLVDVALPSGVLAQGGQTYVLTDDQYLMLSPTASATLFSSVTETGEGEGAVSSVNTQTGDVVLTAANVGALAVSNNLSDVGSASTARTSLGLGNSATLAVGTSAGTVAAGNDSRITGAAQKSANLSDLAAASTSRTNLGLGGAATLNVGTSSGTVAAGDDSRITGALHAANNLSDVANVTSSRTSLGITSWRPSDAGLLAATYDPIFAGTTWNPMSTAGASPVVGIVFLTKITIHSPITWTNLLYGLAGNAKVASTAGGTTAGENFFGVYDTTGTQRGVSADQSTAFTGATGVKTVPWTTPFSAAAGDYFIALVLNGNWDNNTLTFKATGGGSTANVGLTAPNFRLSNMLTGQTTLPPSLTLANQLTTFVTGGACSQWYGVS